jgi:hypothetical protein
MFNPDVIAELLAKKLLFINNDRDSGILTIKLQCDPNLLTEDQKNELKKFVDAILKELDEFKKENGISANCATLEKDKEGNILSLRINLPTPKIYDDFIMRLADKNLLPMQNIQQEAEEKILYEEGKNHFNPTPLSTKLMPSANHNRKSITVAETLQLENEKPQSVKESSPMRPKSILDGLKPKGWK